MNGEDGHGDNGLSPWLPTSRAGVLAFVAAIVLMASIPATLISYGLLIGGQGDLEEALVGVCGRAKLDRVDNARGWTVVEEIIEGSATDPNVPASQRRRYAENLAKVGESANQLRSRIFQCEPLIEDAEEIIDEALLREAQGDL